MYESCGSDPARADLPVQVLPETELSENTRESGREGGGGGGLRKASGTLALFLLQLIGWSMNMEMLANQSAQCID